MSYDKHSTAAVNTAAIELVDLSRRFGQTWAVNGLSLKVPAGKHEAVARLGDSLIAGAATVLPDDPEFLKREHEAVRTRLAAELVDASGEKLGKLAQPADCASFLQEDGIATVIRKRSAALNP